MAAIGIGSLGGGALLSVAHRFGYGDDGLLTAAGIMSAVALAVLALARSVPVANVALGVAGAITLLQLATLNAVAQLALPAAIRGRGLAIYLAVTVGGIAAGSLIWGALWDAFSVPAALAIFVRSLPLSQQETNA